MNILDILEKEADDLFRLFSQVYLFGSALDSNTPTDIDLLLIYDKMSLTTLVSEKRRIETMLLKKVNVEYIDFTTLNKTELEQTKFLYKGDCVRIK